MDSPIRRRIGTILINVAKRLKGKQISIPVRICNMMIFSLVKFVPVAVCMIIYPLTLAILLRLRYRTNPPETRARENWFLLLVGSSVLTFAATLAGITAGLMAFAVSETYFTCALVFGLVALLVSTVGVVAVGQKPVRGFKGSFKVTTIIGMDVLVVLNIIVLAGYVIRIPR